MSRVWAGRRVLITSGPTREFLDPIRFLSNASSGCMGLELARAAKRLGARVTVVSGPTTLSFPHGIHVVPVITALEMRAAALKYARRADVVIAAAAVSDWRIKRFAAQKIKRSDRPLQLTLIPNPDIISDVVKRRPKGSRQIAVGFALETQRHLKFAHEKLKRKGLDLIVANSPHSLNAQRARIAMIFRNQPKPQILPEMSKARVARAICKGIETFL